MFYTPYTRPDHPGEVNSGELLVETAGYVSAQKRIEALMHAGQRLVESRRAAYDYEPDDDVNEDRYDPTRDPGYDIVDAQNDAAALTARISARQAERSTKEPESDESNESGE